MYRNKIIIIALLLSPLLFTSFRTSKTPTMPANIKALLTKNTCLVCHSLSQRVVGPPFEAIAKKKYTAKQIMSFVENPQPSHWPGYPPMAPLKNVPKKELEQIANWIVSLGK